MKARFYIMDGSYSLAITKDGRLESRNGFELGGIHWGQPRSQVREFEIIATNCSLPADDAGFNDPSRRCDTIARCVKTGEIVFTKERYLRIISNKCPCCGK